MEKAYPPNLLSGIDALSFPHYHELNKHARRNDRLLHAVLCAYAKHKLDCPDITWNQLGDILEYAILNETGCDAFRQWAERLKCKHAKSPPHTIQD